ncbi:MAG TPA: hypothetical protein EYP59_13175 [Thiotrichaceae bacterium]|nr:hypothetical protein [Thiotrichaceae bacterium]
MQKITLNSRIGSDGFLNLKMPNNLINTECKITVILQPITPMESKPKTPEELGWTPGFFERTAGAWEGEPLTRDEQGEYEQREALL